jgi:hypothetical protein
MAPPKKTSRGRKRYEKYYDVSDRRPPKSVSEAKQQTRDLAESVKRPARKLNRKRPASGTIGSYIKKRNKALDY